MSNEQNTAEQLHSVAIHLLRRLREQDRLSGLSPSRLSALSVIVFAGRITLRDLATAEQVRPPTMTRIVHALEQKGLVQRQQNTEDGRSTLLSATTAGKKQLLKGRSRRTRSLKEQIDTLTSDEQSTLREAIRILNNILLST